MNEEHEQIRITGLFHETVAGLGSEQTPAMRTVSVRRGSLYLQVTDVLPESAGFCSAVPALAIRTSRA